MLHVLAVIAFTIPAFRTFTVAGGAWMFVQRWSHPTADVQAAFDLDAVTAGAILQGYVIMAVVACALLDG
ncbi:hypothetical protein [Haloactinomyces albus]|uniref:Uncharacterized protein n=1 Tax=Haloactinomyces albus TaxID=1352928 RepID=A0AAE4CPP1_9ACTN|nr:hypothetical protein [Haloactinomyces albus]MDR7304646.1 hypothetical protein [Haloactinomyces albus]